ncbi:hypothetical protein EOA13_12365 [Mesorhizobium sp. M7A.F.Ca.US.011.01.1.1]|nr:hypothetical protein EOA13_12365 [Mesorhizobium sp. M7A.F.Ca.US.011.01.1.1]
MDVDAITISLFIASAVRLSVPIMLASLGELVSERAGVFNIGLEGIMLLAAFGAVLGLQWTGQPLAAVAAGAACGVAAAASLAVAVAVLRADQIVAGIGKIVVQLWHVGRISHNSLQPGGGKPVVPSAIRAKTYLINPYGSGIFCRTSEPRALERDELPGIVEDFRRAAKSAVEDAGFDGVEIHGANGYLLDQVLRSGSNHRTDKYGGSIQNRERFPFEVVDAIVGQVRAG